MPTDTGSPRSLMDIDTTKNVTQNMKNIQIEKCNGNTKTNCFNNEDIPVVAQLRWD